MLYKMYCNIVAGSCLGKSTVMSAGYRIKKPYDRSSDVKGLSILYSKKATFSEALKDNLKKKSSLADLGAEAKTYLLVEVDDMPYCLPDYFNAAIFDKIIEGFIAWYDITKVSTSDLNVVILSHIPIYFGGDIPIYLVKSSSWLVRQKRFVERSGKLLEGDLFESMKAWQDSNYGLDYLRKKHPDVTVSTFDIKTQYLTDWIIQSNI